MPWGKKLSDLKGSSCTICLKKKEIEYTNQNNGFTKDDYLQLCKIINEDTVLLGIHWGAEFELSNKKKKERIIKFAQSLLRLMKCENKKILLFGDTNANPDVDIRNIDIAKDDGREFEVYLNNCMFEHIMKCVGLEEVKPNPCDKTTNFRENGTRIDRVFTNMPVDKVNVKVEGKFLKHELSDHAALIITIE